MGHDWAPIYFQNDMKGIKIIGKRKWKNVMRVNSCSHERWTDHYEQGLVKLIPFRFSSILTD